MIEVAWKKIFLFLRPKFHGLDSGVRRNDTKTFPLDLMTNGVAKPLSFYNTLTDRDEPFVPLSPGQVKLYVCGVTPYDECHLGHARCYVTFDFVRRALTRLGYTVTHVQNFTDIDDKIIARAAKNGETPQSLAERCTADYFDKMDRLNVARAHHYPRVTQHIPAILRMVETLVQKGLAYSLDGDVYFSVRKFSGYGKLSRRDIDSLRVGARVDVNDRKRDPLDFALWKSAKEGEPFWPSPWGLGRPGWHIECSAMSLEAFGSETFDIHGGGQDLIFPHHENEIAQSESCTGRPFARYWVHNGFVTVQKEKMSKSLGNFFTLKGIFERVSPRAVRYFLLSHHYRGPLEFSESHLNDARDRLAEMDEDVHRWEAALSVPREASLRAEKEWAMVLDSFVSSVDNSLAENFNSPRVLAAVFTLLAEMKERLDQPKTLSTEGLRQGLRSLREVLDGVLGIAPALNLVGDETDDVQLLVDAREKARRLRDWAEADRLRLTLADRGIFLEDTPGGPRWWKKI